MKFPKIVAFLFAIFMTAVLRADNARFDLPGPAIEVRVTRGDSTLPIAEVPNLLPGDKIWLKADLPPNQSNHLLLIVAFLRGTTNEPPDNWFTEIDTWEKKTAEGTTVIVPNQAEQALIFVAPETGGDFKTLRSAVKGKPGLFIRADADLNEASFEQQRIERYLAAMKTISQNEQKAIQDRSTKLAATLALKPNSDCFKQPVDQQVNCLTQSSAPILLSDGHGQSIAETLSSGPSSDFINAASVTPTAAGGAYSAYVGAIVDLVHLASTLHTAQYQYIPGLSFPQDSTLNLKLNAPPSFTNPKTVIVIGLPAIQKAKLPPLRPHDPTQVACLLQPQMALPLEGAPLVFSTSFAHDLVLRLNRPGALTEIPLTADAFEGGLVVTKQENRKPLSDARNRAGGKAPAEVDVNVSTNTDLTVTGTVWGYWGFDHFEGPTVTLQQIAGTNWKIVNDTQLLSGQDKHLTLKGDGIACVRRITLTDSKNKDVAVTFNAAARNGTKDAQDTIALDISVREAEPGGYTLSIAQYGDSNPDKVQLTAYDSDINLEVVKIHKDDNTAILTGSGLKNVLSVAIADQTFTPADSGNDDKAIHLQAKAGVSPDDGSDATVMLKDGRTMTVKISIGAARPALKLLSFEATAAEQDSSIPLSLGAKDEIPLSGKLTFVVQTKDAFPRSQSIEVATADGSVHTSVSILSNNLVLQDDHTAVATVDPLRAFGQSAFGKLQVRPVAEDGTSGDWTQLGTLVRTPQITAIRCTTVDAPTCAIDGRNFFLVQSFGAAKDFAKSADVPTGFAENTFSVPTPADGTTLYLRLRDDPDVISALTLPTPVPKPAAARGLPAQTSSPTADPASITHDAAPSPGGPTPTSLPGDQTTKPASSAPLPATPSQGSTQP